MRTAEKHQSMIDLDGQIKDFQLTIEVLEQEVTIASVDDPTKRKKLRQLQRSTNVLIMEYNRQLRLMKPVEQYSIDVPFIERVYRLVSPRLANGLRFYFRNEGIEGPTREQFLLMDPDVIFSVRNMGTQSHRELSLIIQRMSAVQ